MLPDYMLIYEQGLMDMSGLITEASNKLVQHQQMQRHPVGLPQGQQPVGNPNMGQDQMQQINPAPKNYSQLPQMLEQMVNAHSQNRENQLLNQGLDAISQWISYMRQHLSQ